MIEWAMVLAGGLLGSSHCVGMCGAFALTLGTTGSKLTANLARQLVYGLGRVFTYTVAGLAAGYAGWRLASEMHFLVNAQALLCILAGVLLIVQGLASAGVLRRLPGFSTQGPCLGAGMFAALLRETRLRSAFLGGMINGLLPCGLVYAYLALSASTGAMWRGGLTMTLFGLGTIPILALVGCGGQVLSLAARQYILRIAAWLVVLTGIISVGRGVMFLFPAASATGDCPLCQ